MRPEPTVQQQVDDIDRNLAHKSRQLRQAGLTDDQRSILIVGVNGLLDRRYTLRPTVHTSTSEETWATLKRLETS